MKEGYKNLTVVFVMNSVLVQIPRVYENGMLSWFDFGLHKIIYLFVMLYFII